VDQYVGTSPEYATYANKTEAPLKAKDSPENKVLESFAASPIPATLKVDGNIEYEGEKKSKEADEARGSDTSGADSSVDTTGAAKQEPPAASGN
jgi:hypothetical protein